MTVAPEIRQALARLYLATEWVVALPIPDAMADDAHRDFDCWRIYAGQVRRVIEAREALLAVLAQPDPERP